MVLAYILRVELVSWAVDDGLSPTKLPGATYTLEKATNRPSSWITNSLSRLPPL
jgi:hypothetical protein